MGHGCGEAGASHEHVHPGDRRGQKDRRLAGGVAATDQGDFGPGAHARFKRRGPIPDAAALELRETRHVGPSILRAAGDDDDAGAQLSAVGEHQGKLAARTRLRAVELRSLRGDQDLRAEFLRLHKGAAGERLPRDPRRKAEVILDARAGASLSAEGAAVEHDDAQAFGSRVNGRRQPGRSGTDHDHVDKLVPRARVEHAEAASQFLFGGVEQYRAVGAGHQNLAHGPSVLLEHRRRGGIVLRIDDVMRVGVSLQERLQSQQVGGVRLTDQHGSSPRFDQAHPAQYQRAHDSLTEIRLGDDQRAQFFRRHEQRLDVFLGVAIHQPRRSGKLSNLPEEMAGAFLRDGHDTPQAVTQADGNRPLQHHEHSGGGLARGEQALAHARSAALRRSGGCARCPRR